MNYTEQFLAEAVEIVKLIDRDSIERTAELVARLRERGLRFLDAPYAFPGGPDQPR